MQAQEQAQENVQTDPATATLSQPAKGEGLDLWRMAQREPRLDTNSEYCYHLLQLHHAETCVIARNERGEPVGFIAGTRPQSFHYGDAVQIPAEAAGNTLFIWQVAVDPSQRGTGLAGRMLQHILERPGNEALRFVQGTVIPGNAPSENFFRSIARRYDCDLKHECLIPADEQAQEGSPEFLFHIGPIR